VTRGGRNLEAIDLKLFTAHATGNLVVIAALLVTGGPSS